MLQTLRRPASTSTPPVGSSAGPTKQNNRKRWAAALVATAVLGGGLLLRFGPWTNRQRDLTPYTVVAERGALSGVITASGELLAVQRVNVSPRKQGLLAELLVDEGDVVQQGQLLAVMDRGDLDDRLQERQALLQQAEAKYRSTKDDFDRREQLFRTGVISADEFSDVRNEFLADSALVVAARERLEQLEQESREQQIRAPFDGTITARFAEPGAFVTPTTTASATAGAIAPIVSCPRLEALRGCRKAISGIVGQPAEIGWTLFLMNVQGRGRRDRGRPKNRTTSVRGEAETVEAKNC